MTLIDLTGQRFGKLTVIKRAGTYYHPRSIKTGKRYSNPTWLCKCDCGAERIVLGRNLTSGGTRSCGCIRKEKRGRRYEDQA